MFETFDLFDSATRLVSRIVPAFQNLYNIFFTPLDRLLENFIDNPLFELASAAFFPELLSYSIFDLMFTVGLPTFIFCSLVIWVLKLIPVV